MMIRFLALAPLLAIALPAHAQDEEPKPPRRYRVSLGPQLSPNYPGADKLQLTPMLDVATARGDAPFPFVAADDSFGFALLDKGGFEFGPAANFQGSRRRSEAGAPIDEVSTTIELGGYAQYWLAKPLRLHAELRKGINGHGGVIGGVGLDYVTRDGDKWLVSIGPRITLSDAKYRRAYFEVTPAVAARTGLPVYRADGGAVHALGVSSTATWQFSRRWGLYGYTRYDRLVGDGADSPLSRGPIGSRNQFSGGLGLSFTFGKGVR
ncbi:MAG: MipA/OmpV family protein [Sphingomonas sp.]|uniref:MipA/OmpV family protein n=1 Tax=unclassified Sphingomonas TaxID=196159 RepID=UPI002455EE7C|nr:MULTISPECIES: MipA/OmpV family protein [unclassified Sphingomonas]MBQ1497129.1 MipA/OmpV family protein [Sphingomonas sp.]MDH4743198.1 MipA/OmpV family protein [Sphingomonas sp. CBMAI 2297]